MKSLLNAICLAGSLWFSADYNPYVDGARAAIRIVVCDERGKPVPNAHLIIGFQQSPERGKTVMGTTDARGAFCCEETTASIVNVWAEKDGYYKTHVRKSVAVRAKTEVIGSRRWSQEPVAITFVLKAMRNPLKLTCHSVDFNPFPDTNAVVKLDLETLAWCPPYGNGQHDDLHPWTGDAGALRAHRREVQPVHRPLDQELVQSERERHQFGGRAAVRVVAG